MARVLWISDAGTNTGFSGATHAIGERLVEDYGHNVHVLAIGWDAAIPYLGPLKLYRAAAGRANHPLGFDRIPEVLHRAAPDVVVTLEDPGVLLARLTENVWDPDRQLAALPVISYLPVDGVNQPPGWQELSELTHVVTMSKFGQEQFPGSELIPHGVDANLWHPIDEEHPLTLSNGTDVHSKAECREAFGVPQGAFIVGRIDTNSGRKDYGSAFRIMEGVRQNLLDREVLAFWHTRADQPAGINLNALISRGETQYAVTNADDWPVENVVALMNTFDIFLSTSRGEGFGLSLAQSLACGVPVVATDCSAITEVVGPGGICVTGQAYMTNPYGVDQMLADVPAMVTKIVHLARSPEARHRMGVLGREHVRLNNNWDVAAGKFHSLIEAHVAQAEAADLAAAQRRTS